MANQPHDNNKPPKTPVPGKAPLTPKPIIPNMSIDDPEEPTLEAEEVFEDGIPVVEAAPASEVAESIFVDDEVVAEEVAEVVPASEVIDAEPELAEAEVMEDEPIEVLASDMVEAEPVAAAPSSDVDLMQVFEETPPPAEPVAAAEPIAPVVETPTYAKPPHAVEAAPLPPLVIDEAVAAYDAHEEHAGPETHVAPAEAIAQEITASPASGVIESGEFVQTAPPAVMESAEIAEAAPASAVLESEEIAEAAPASAVLESEEIAEAAPASAVHEAEEVVEAAPASAVLESEEIAEAAPASAVVEAEEIAEAAPASAVLESEEIAEAAPASAVLESEEVAEAAPASAVIESEIAEASPASAVLETEEIAEASPASGVLFDEAAAEASPMSEAQSAEEVVEAAEEVSSATRKSEAVLDDETVAAEAASAAEVFDEAPASAFAEEAVLDDEIAEAVEAGSSAVLFDSAVEAASAVPSSGIAFEQTMTLDSAGSGARKSDSDVLAAEDEWQGTAEASAVDLGEMPARKGSSVQGIDKVAEALESGVDLGAEPPESMVETVPSVEFDELLDEVEEPEEAKPKAKKVTAKDEDSSTEMDVIPIDEDLGAKKKTGKKDKKIKVPADDDVDLDSLFGEAESAEAEEAEEAKPLDADEAEAAEMFDAEEAEAAEALDTEEASEAEAAEAFDAEEAEAAEAFDADEETPTKKTKTGAKTRMTMDDDEAEAVDAEEEDASAKKKKGKKDKGKKEKATVAPAAAPSSGFLRVFIGMCLAGILLVGVAAGGLFLAPGQVREMVNQVDPPKPPQPPPPTPKLALAHEAMDKSDYDSALAALANATKDSEFSVRGEARWLKYLKKIGDAPPDAADPEVQTAVKDLAKGSDKVLVGVVDATLKQNANREKLAKLQGEKEAVDKMLVEVTAKKDDAEKKLEATEKKVDSFADALVKGKYINDKADFNEAALGKVLKTLTDKQAILEAIDKTLNEQVKKTGVEGLDEVLVKKKDADDKLAAVNKVLLDKGKVDTRGAKGVQEVVDARDDLLMTIKTAFQELVDAKIVADDKLDPRKELVKGVQKAREQAESPLSIPLAQLGMSLGSIGSGTSKAVEKNFSTAKLAAELGWFQAREKFIETPQQKMTTYAALLQDRAEKNAKRLKAMELEAQWVLDPESKSDLDARANARFVQGLAHRNLHQFGDARAAFTDASKMAPGNAVIRKSLKELTDPDEYYVPRMRKSLAAGDPAAALDEANIALKAMPDQGELYAQRGLIRLKLLPAEKAKITDDAQKAIRADADEAKTKNDKLASESAYIHGLLDERLEKWTEAEKNFREAIKLHQGPADGAGKYRVALARLLLRDQAEQTPPADDADNNKKKKDGARLPSSSNTIALHPLSLLIVSAVIAQPAPDDVDDEATKARYKEAEEQALKLIASNDKDLKGAGYLALGKVLSKQGKRTEGLKAYAKGLGLIHPDLSTKELKELIDQHPAFQQPDSAGVQNPLMSERYFGEGLHYYWAKKYPEAEAQFRQAVKYFDKDARYWYFLGLAQIHQKTSPKRDAAIYSMEKGADLEARAALSNPDAVREVNASLERIQGELRQYLNNYRYKAKSADPEAK